MYVMAAAMIFGLAATLWQGAVQSKEIQKMNEKRDSAVLSTRQQTMVPVAALAATGDIERLGPALEQALDNGMTINDAKEILVQVYAYAGFPRSLNALGELKKVVDARQARGVKDEQGRLPSKPAPKGDALLAAGTANQTKLSGAPVKGALFDFAPAIDEYLKTHLFGDIFERDNLDWQSREIATVSMLASMRGVESQLQSHVKIAMNVGLTTDQLNRLAQVLVERVDADAGLRVRAAVAKANERK